MVDTSKIAVIPMIIRFKQTAFSILSVIGLYYLWDPSYLIYTFIAYFLFSAIGHDIGLHRYWTHRSFVCKNKIAEGFIWVCAFLGGISDPISYAKRHTWHHAHSDKEDDNLQPVKHPFLTWNGYGILKAKNVRHETSAIWPELANSKFHQFVNRYYFILYYVTMAVCFIIDFKLSFYTLVVGANIAHHVGSANSVINHRYGYRNFNTDDHTTNNTIFNYLSFGLGLHNNHHKFPYSYTNKIKDNEIDPTAWMIKHIFASSVMEPKL